MSRGGPSLSSPPGGGGPRSGGGGRPGEDLARGAPLPAFGRTPPSGGRDAHLSSPVEGGGPRSGGEGLTTRNAGYIACLVGTLVMIAGRFMHGAPVWLVYVGLSGVVFGWGLLGLSMIRAAAEARLRRANAASTISKE